MTGGGWETGSGGWEGEDPFFHSPCPSFSTLLLLLSLQVLSDPPIPRPTNKYGWKGGAARHTPTGGRDPGRASHPSGTLLPRRDSDTATRSPAWRRQVSDRPTDGTTTSIPFRSPVSIRSPASFCCTYHGQFGHSRCVQHNKKKRREKGTTLVTLSARSSNILSLDQHHQRKILQDSQIRVRAPPRAAPISTSIGKAQSTGRREKTETAIHPDSH